MARARCLSTSPVRHKGLGQRAGENSTRRITSCGRFCGGKGSWAPLMNDNDALSPAERRLLAQMPLHAITSVHGEAGLRERLMLDIAAFPVTGRERVEQALRLASRLHAADRRQREPYMSHLLRVAIRIISHYRVRDADVACAALLHDAVEDHADGLALGGGQPGALSVLAGQVGQRAAC